LQQVADLGGELVMLVCRNHA